jgi:hypothetical protein
MDNFNKQAFITKVKPHTDKLITYLQKNNIEFIPNDSLGKNVIFKSEEKEIVMSHHSFYGVSKMGAVRKDIGESSFIFIPVTDEMFIGGVMKSILELHFNLGKKSK